MMSDTDHNPADYFNLEEAFIHEGYALAERRLNIDYTREDLLMGVSALYASVDGFITLFLDQARLGDSPADCKKGCAWCCHQAVYAESHELEFLTDWLRNHLTEEERSAIVLAGKIKSSYTARLEPEGRSVFKYPCPLLSRNACMAYEARPMACRIYLSFELDSCIHEFKLPEDDSRFPKLFDMPLRAGRNMNLGFTERMRELGSNPVERPLEEGLLAYLTEEQND